MINSGSHNSKRNSENYIYQISKKETKYKSMASKSVLLNKNLKKGVKIQLRDLSLKRIKNNDNNLKNPNLIIGKITKKKLKKNQILKQSLFR